MLQIYISMMIKRFSKSNILLILTLLLQLHPLFSLGENHYGDCLPKKCGNLSIRFPFYMINQQEKYCGLDGFEVSCTDDGLALFNISDTYIIKNIWYELDKFQIVNSALVGENCFNSLKNLSLGVNKRLTYAKSSGDILVFPNCSNKTVEEYKEKKVKCKSLAAYKNEPIVKDLEGKCGLVTLVPYYEDGQSQSGGKILDVLLEGILLNWNAHDCTGCVKSGGQCGFDADIFQFSCFCPDRTHRLRCVQTNRGWWRLILGLAVGGTVFMLLAIIAICYRKKLKIGKSTHTNLWIKGNARMNQNVQAFLKGYGSLAPKRYTYAEIRKMTNHFKEKVGEGGYGAVYKGKLHDSCLVAVKKLQNIKGDGKDFINEVVSMGQTNHVNIVTLLGFCFEGEKRALVYEFLPNGSLEKFMHNASRGQSLELETLFNISVGIAKGLHYLHRGCNMRILHFDIKPHNILLDKELCPKISDFGLARLCPTKDSLISMSEARGTIGYIAPEVFLRNIGGVSHKSDVYSYGMMLLDLLCGREKVVSTEAQSTNSTMYFPEWIYNQLEFGETEVDGIMNEDKKKLKRKMVLVSLWCIQTYPSNRPPINQVLEMLEGPFESIQKPPKPHLSSPPIFDFHSSDETHLYSAEN